MSRVHPSIQVGRHPENDRFQDLSKTQSDHPIGFMPQSLVQLHVHVVFSTASRQPLLHDMTIRRQMHKYLHGVCRNLDSPALKIDGPSDHVHLLCRMGKQRNVSDLVRDLKRSSSHWIRKSQLLETPFSWQRGYGAFSASAAELAMLVEYIENQEAHHRQFSFKDEFRKLCQENGLVVDERYVWE